MSITKQALLEGLLLKIYEELSKTQVSSKYPYTSKISRKSLEQQNITSLKNIKLSLEMQIHDMNVLLVRMLIFRDKIQRRQEFFCDIITKCLKKIAMKIGEQKEMKFQLNAPITNLSATEFNMNTIITTSSDFEQWLHAMKMVARLPGGMPPEFRRKLWLALSEKYFQTKNVSWEKEEQKCFSESFREDDEELGIQIVKDLHRTGSSLCSGPAGSINQAKLKKILLGYARWNPEVGYCQGFNMLGALILQVMDKNESESIKVMIFLIEGILPTGYFSGSLGGLQADMAVFRELMTARLPKLAKHLQKLQGPLGEGSLEPPLTNVFTMQWFLTMFCTCLPMTCVLRVWDLVLIEGSDVLLRTALAIWSILEEKVMTIKTADDFYCKMGILSGELLNGHLIDSNGLIERVVKLGPIAELQKMRDKHLYNIAPWRDKKGLKLYFSDEEPDSDDDSHLAVTTVWGLRGLHRRGSSGLPSSSKTDRKDSLALDISILKKQYEKLRERQRQAHIILTSAVAKQTMNTATSSGSLQMNHLLMGRSAIVTNRGRKLGPAPGSVPPARKTPPMTMSKIVPKQKQQQQQQEILSKTRKSIVIHQDDKSTAISSTNSSLSSGSPPTFTRPRKQSESSSYSDDSDNDIDSSSSTSLCDDFDENDSQEVLPSSIESSPFKKKVVDPEITEAVKQDSETSYEFLIDTVEEKASMEDKNDTEKEASLDLFSLTNYEPYESLTAKKLQESNVSEEINERYTSMRDKNDSIISEETNTLIDLFSASKYSPLETQIDAKDVSDLEVSDVSEVIRKSLEEKDDSMTDKDDLGILEEKTRPTDLCSISKYRSIEQIVDVNDVKDSGNVLDVISKTLEKGDKSDVLVLEKEPVSLDLYSTTKYIPYESLLDAKSPGKLEMTNLENEDASTNDKKDDLSPVKDVIPQDLYSTLKYAPYETTVSQVVNVSGSIVTPNVSEDLCKIPEKRDTVMEDENNMLLVAKLYSATKSEPYESSSIPELSEITENVNKQLENSNKLELQSPKKIDLINWDQFERINSPESIKINATEELEDDYSILNVTDDLNSTISASDICKFEFHSNSNTNDLFNLSQQSSSLEITSTSQLSPIADISKFLSISSISPLRTPSMHFDYSDLISPAKTTTTTAQDNQNRFDNEKFSITEEGVTNEYFERVNLVDRPKFLNLSSHSLKTDKESNTRDKDSCEQQIDVSNAILSPTIIVDEKDTLSMSFVLNKSSLRDFSQTQEHEQKQSPIEENINQNYTSDDDNVDEDDTQSTFLTSTCKNITKEKAFSFEESFNSSNTITQKSDIRPKSCPDWQTECSSYLMRNESNKNEPSDQVLRIIQENSLILHRLMKKTFLDESNSSLKDDYEENDENLQIIRSHTPENEIKFFFEDSSSYETMEPVYPNKRVEPEFTSFDNTKSVDFKPIEIVEFYETDSKGYYETENKSIDINSSSVESLKQTTEENNVVEKYEYLKSYNYPVCSDDENDNESSSPRHCPFDCRTTTTTLRTTKDDNNLTDRLESIKNTIKSIDSLCEDRYKKEKCQKYIDSLFEHSETLLSNDRYKDTVAAIEEKYSNKPTKLSNLEHVLSSNKCSDMELKETVVPIKISNCMENESGFKNTEQNSSNSEKIKNHWLSSYSPPKEESTSSVIDVNNKMNEKNECNSSEFSAHLSISPRLSRDSRKDISPRRCGKYESSQEYENLSRRDQIFNKTFDSSSMTRIDDKLNNSKIIYDYLDNNTIISKNKINDECDNNQYKTVDNTKDLNSFTINCNRSSSINLISTPKIDIPPTIEQSEIKSPINSMQKFSFISHEDITNNSYGSQLKSPLSPKISINSPDSYTKDLNASTINLQENSDEISNKFNSNDNEKSLNRIYQPAKLELRHTTVTATFYDRYLSQKLERNSKITKNSKPSSPITTKMTNFDSSFLKPIMTTINDRNSKSNENSPSRNISPTSSSPSSSSFMSSSAILQNRIINDTKSLLTSYSTTNDLHIRSCDNIVLRLKPTSPTTTPSSSLVGSTFKSLRSPTFPSPSFNIHLNNLSSPKSPELSRSLNFDRNTPTDLTKS